MHNFWHNVTVAFVKKLSKRKDTEPGFLFAMPSLLSGMAQVLVLGGQFARYNKSLTPEDADVHALLSDWTMVRIDLKTAFDKLFDQQPEFIEEFSRVLKIAQQQQQAKRSGEHLPNA